MSLRCQVPQVLPTRYVRYTFSAIRSVWPWNLPAAGATCKAQAAMLNEQVVVRVIAPCSLMSEAFVSARPLLLLLAQEQREHIKLQSCTFCICVLLMERLQMAELLSLSHLCLLQH